MREKERQVRVSEQGGSDRDVPGHRVRSSVCSTLNHITTTGTPGLITLEQGTNNHGGLGWPILPCTALCQAKFDLSRAYSHNDVV